MRRRQISNICLLSEGSYLASVLDGNRNTRRLSFAFSLLRTTWSTTGNVSLTLGAHQLKISQLTFLIPKTWTIEKLTDFWKLPKSLLISRYLLMFIISFLCFNRYAQGSYFYFTFFGSFKRRFLPEISIIIELKFLIPSLSRTFSHATLRISR